MEAAQHLDTVRREEGLLRHIAVTNFDAAHLKELLDAGIPICANQVQYVECIHDCIGVGGVLINGVFVCFYGMLQSLT